MLKDTSIQFYTLISVVISKFRRFFFKNRMLLTDTGILIQLCSHFNNLVIISSFYCKRYLDYSIYHYLIHFLESVKDIDRLVSSTYCWCTSMHITVICWFFCVLIIMVLLLLHCLLIRLCRACQRCNS